MRMGRENGSVELFYAFQTVRLFPCLSSLKMDIGRLLLFCDAVLPRRRPIQADAGNGGTAYREGSKILYKKRA